MKCLNVDRARELRATMTDAEQRLWRYLRNRQLQGFKFRRQHQIGCYIADFVCTEAMLIVELDGGQHLGQMEYDERRTRQLKIMGYNLLRFWNNDVLTDTESVLEVILTTLASPAPHPSPLPDVERGQAAAEIEE
ncbi:endonuclease domain-containing protein [Rhodanobacter sp. BL-MT-08]